MTTPQKKKSFVLSIRLSPEERTQLEIDAAGMSLSDYGRSRIFNQNSLKKRTRGKHPVKDHRALAQILRELGRIQISNHLNEISKAVQTGSLEVTLDTEKAIQDGCQDIFWIRNTLVSALGLKVVNDYDP